VHHAERQAHMGAARARRGEGQARTSTEVLLLRRAQDGEVLMASARSTRTPAERAVWDSFLDCGYHAMGCCKSPACETPHAVVMTAGVKPDARICVTCFEFDFGCKHPSRAKLAGMRS
jgi:hypothetical protein